MNKDEYIDKDTISGNRGQNSDKTRYSETSAVFIAIASAHRNDNEDALSA